MLTQAHLRTNQPPFNANLRAPLFGENLCRRNLFRVVSLDYNYATRSLQLYFLGSNSQCALFIELSQTISNFAYSDFCQFRV